MLTSQPNPSAPLPAPALFAWDLRLPSAALPAPSPPKLALPALAQPSPATFFLSPRTRKPPVATPDTSQPFTNISPAALATLLNTSRSDTLLIDFRPNGPFLSSRILGAINISVPSTLLRRPAFSLEKISAMISPPIAKQSFLRWPTVSHIVVYDAESTTTSSSTIDALLRKFDAEIRKSGSAKPPALHWLDGGFAAFSKHHPTLVDQNHLDDNPGAALNHRLPSAAFSASSTLHLDTPGAITPGRVASNPFYNNIREDYAVSACGPIPLALPEHVLRRADDLPFPWLRNIVRKASAAATEPVDALAAQFTAIELAEQKRLIGIMDYHSHQTTGQSTFPYSIVAGFEKGTKNRYRNIWPFEHARVRLLPEHEGNDYINASYVEPLGTRKRYIATQGPSEATFADFWLLCWQQQVETIVMLTREVEGNQVKCGRYWADGQYGPISVHLVSTEGTPAPDDLRPGVPTPDGSRSFDLRAGPHSKTVRRVLELRRGAQTRRVTQLQFLEWPDLNVPDDARGVLDLVAQADADAPRGPALVHCSAGVGRTGAFIMVDAVLDAVRTELRAAARKEREGRPERPRLDRMLSEAPIAPSGARWRPDARSPTLGPGAPVPAPASGSAGPRRRAGDPDVAPTSRLTAAGPDDVPAPAPPAALIPPAEASDAPHTVVPRARQQDDDAAPQPLSAYAEPVRAVLEDMRQQRMSLCQTLRQYVFVHRAIVEGALRIVDEEKARAAQD